MSQVRGGVARFTRCRLGVSINALVILVGFSASLVFAQQSSSNLDSALGKSTVTQNGSTTGGKANSESGNQAPSTLSLEEAIQLAIRNNLGTLVATERQNEAKGLLTESRSSLLPNVSGAVSQKSSTENLAALGFSLPGSGIPSFIGPFNVFDARLSLAQSLLNLSSIRHYQAAKAGVKVSEFQQQLAREQVSSLAALAYLAAIRTARNVQSAQSNLDLAQTLLTLAENQKGAGIATGVDVTRAQTRVAQEQFNLAQAQTAAQLSFLQLLRVTGLALNSSPVLTDQLRFTNDPSPSEQTAISAAEEQRREILIAEEQIKQDALEVQAARSEYLPSADFFANYGSSGITPGHTDFPTRDVGVRVNIPVFNGALTHGRVQVATSRQRQSELQLTDIKRQVELDVRNALQTLRTASAQVTAGDQSVTLAERELQMSRDRFSAGVGDNIEVVNAQTSLANARDAQVNSLTAYNEARINLAAALGRVEQFKW